MPRPKRRTRTKSGVSVELEGLEELRAKLNELPEQTRVGAGRALEESAEAIADDMRDEVPVDSGNLQDSIRAEVDVDAFRAEVGPEKAQAHYGYFIEFGTTSITPRPFAVPAGENERGRFPDRVRRYVTEEIPEA